jgi:small-conductance mechanosensitive channel
VLVQGGADVAAIADPPAATESAVQVLAVPGHEHGVVLRRTRDRGVVSWRFTPASVRDASAMAAEIDRGPIGRHVPRALIDAEFATLEAWQWIGLLIAIALALVLAIGIGRATSRVLCFVARGGETKHEVERVLARARGPIRTAIGLGILGVLARLLDFSAESMIVLGRLYTLAWFLAIGWIFVRAVDYAAERVSEHAAAQSGWRARGVRTRVMILRRVLHVVGLVILISALLLQFDTVRELGVSLLASAGVAGIVVGLAAQRTIGNLLAGIQLSFTQPLRVGDQVVVEGEFGTVEEINLSYVVLRLWDQRALIVPMTKLLESPFQNWTRSGSELTGAVLLQVDFSTPLALVRTEVEKFVRSHPLFDGRTFGVQVTDSDARTATLRVLVSAADAGKTFDLRCATREFLIDLLQKLDRGRYFPRVRVDEPGEKPSDKARAIAPS